MQNNNIYKYTKYFQPSLRYSDGVNTKFLNALKKLHELYSVDPPKNSFKTSITWELPYHKPYKNIYHTLLRNLSQYMGVRLMYRHFWINNQVVRGFNVIGEYNRVKLFIHISDYYFKALFLYYNEVKRLYTSVSKSYASQLVTVELDITYKFIEKLLVTNKKYNQDLEIYIMGQFKLDYKKYNQETNVYHNAVSKRFYHKSRIISSKHTN